MIINNKILCNSSIVYFNNRKSTIVNIESEKFGKMQILDMTRAHY